MSARKRISDIIQRWFLREPLLFTVWTTHKLVINPRLETIRTRQGSIEYNPLFIDSLSPRELEAVLRSEGIRILLKHPYTRRKENAKLAYTASNITLQEYLRTVLPWPRARDVFGTTEFDQQYFEFYYSRLQELADQQAAATLADSASAGAGGDASQADSSDSSPMPDDSPTQDGHDQPDEESTDSTSPDDSDSETTAEGERDSAADESLSPDADDSNSGTTTEGEGDSATDESPPSPLQKYVEAEFTGHENTEGWDADDLLVDRINEQIRTAHENQSWGTVAGKLREQILATLKPKLDYRTVLRQFRMTILSTQRRLTRMKPSRRYGFLYLGSRRDFTTQLLFAVDVSGSISHEDLQRGFSIVNQFFKYGVQTIDVIQFDTEIKGDPITLKKARYRLNVMGRGGTNFGPIMQYIDTHPRYDGLIVFTDGYAPIPQKPQNRRTRVLWLFNHESSYSHSQAALKHIGPAVFLKAD